MNYQTCTVEQLSQHIQNSTSAAVTQQISYYTKKKMFDVVEKIKQARVLAKILKLTKKISNENL